MRVFTEEPPHSPCGSLAPSAGCLLGGQGSPPRARKKGSLFWATWNRRILCRLHCWPRELRGSHSWACSTPECRLWGLRAFHGREQVALGSHGLCLSDPAESPSLNLPGPRPASGEEEVSEEKGVSLKPTTQVKKGQTFPGLGRARLACSVGRRGVGVCVQGRSAPFPAPWQ